MHGMHSWKEIRESEEALRIRSIAGEQYNARRSVGQRQPRQQNEQVQSREGEMANVKQLLPCSLEPFCWNAGMQAVLPMDMASREDARLLAIFLDVIHPIQFAFYPMSSSSDRSWLVDSLHKNEARYQAALSVSACFDAGLSEKPRIDRIGLNAGVQKRQTNALRGLQHRLLNFNAQSCDSEELVRSGLLMLEIIHQLLSLEIFSMVQGAWEIHHRAAGSLLGTIHTRCNFNTDGRHLGRPYESPLEVALQRQICTDIQRSLHFHVTCFVWVDTIANATLGLPGLKPLVFQYEHLLRANILKTQNIMGCRASIMADIAEITSLHNWKITNLHDKPWESQSYYDRATSLELRLKQQTRKMRQKPTSSNLASWEEDIDAVTLQFAHAASVYFYVTVYSADNANAALARLVEQSQECLAALPVRLLIRVCWPFTIVGCMAGKEHHQFFRDMVAKALGDKQLIGMAWKGLLVMEECWRLRETCPTQAANCDWSTAMQSLGQRVLLV
jgi:hypothetical protein